MQTTDLSYFATDTMFTTFIPNTKAGEQAWTQIASQTDGTGKVFHAQVKATVTQLRKAGYSVSKASKPAPLSADDAEAMLAELEAI